MKRYSALVGEPFIEKKSQISHDTFIDLFTHFFKIDKKNFTRLEESILPTLTRNLSYQAQDPLSQLI